MRWVVLALATVLAVAGCGESKRSTTESKLSTTEACAEVRGPVEDSMAKGDVAGAAEVLGDVATRGDEKVERVFGDAAEAADFVAENGNEDGVPAWATQAFTTLDSTCEPGPGD